MPVVKRVDPYSNTIFVHALHSVYFKGPKSLGRKFAKLFSNSLEAGESDEVEIPPAMLSLIAMAVCLSSI